MQELIHPYYKLGSNHTYITQQEKFILDTGNSGLTWGFEKNDQQQHLSQAWLEKLPK